MKVVGSFAEVRGAVSGLVGLVPTMGYLHEGHLSLITAAREQCDTVVMSLYVNPLQFDQAADLERYPRDRERDVALAAGAGADLVFAPTDQEMYPGFPEHPATRVHVDRLTDHMEGSFRPGHFEGVATVVAKLLAGLRPDRAYFGRKDAQQLIVIRRMAADLSFPVEVAGLPIVREADGMALSSRNVFLGDARARALALWRGLSIAARAAAAGERSGPVLEGLVSEEVTGEGGAVLDYAALASADDATRLSRLDRPAFLAVAARVGAVRLIDNVWLDPDGRADLGIRLTGPSILYGGD